MKHIEIRKKDIKKINWISRMVAIGAAVFALVFASYAWFVNQGAVDGGENIAAADPIPNLVIATSSSKIKTLAIKETSFYISFSKSKGRTLMLPATHDWTVGTDTGLKYPDNARYISEETGLLKSSDLDYGFKAVPLSTTSRYYVDYTVYIASASYPLTNVSLTAKLECTSTKTCHQAATIDFYKSSVKKSNYIGSLNVANKSTGKLTIPLSKKTIPKNTDSYIKLIMRCYFDGALQSDPGHTYIKTADVVTDGLYVTVSFAAADL